jgi:hypothetical protein
LFLNRHVVDRIWIGMHMPPLIPLMQRDHCYVRQFC